MALRRWVAQDLAAPQVEKASSAPRPRHQLVRSMQETVVPVYFEVECTHVMRLVVVLALASALR